MKPIFFICCLALFISCEISFDKKTKPAFLIGNWIRLNDSDGNKTYETWKADFTGFGFTMNNEKTTFKEIMSIVELNDSLHLKVEGVNEKPTYFKFTQQTDTSFVCENQQNDFPNKIHYYLENKQLKAIVSSDDFRIDFIFEKIE